MSEAVTRTQANRVMAISTSLGDNKLLLVEMRGTEAMGRLFEFELDLISEGSLVDFSKILGQNVTIRLNKLDDTKRYFNGFISRFSFAGAEHRNADSKIIYRYRATLVPQAWFLTRAANCRIYQEKTVPDIIKDVCAGMTLSYQLTGKYRQWDYCVQYRETDFNFISRLMENEGIHYYFTHDDGKHTMVLCDSNAAHAAAPGYADLHYDEPDLKSGHDAFIWAWEIEHEITSTKYVLKDYNMTTPKTDLLRTKEIEHKHDPGKFEVYDYPGAYPTGDDGVNYSNVRMQEVEAQYVTVSATSSARGIFAGAIFTLQDHPELDAEDYLVTGASYQMHNDDFAIALGRRAGGPVFQAELTCIPKTYEFRTPRLTPKPVVQGPQTAVIVGPSGEEIYTDKYGRVKVQFYWDRQGKNDENSSCWIRVSQNWAGKNWGIIFHPRMGQEVIVEFLEGDPDRPIITGRVYNADMMPPYTLPANQTQSTIKTRSSKGGTTDNFNEIRFEDKKGSEQLYFHAEKDQTIEVEHDESHSVGHDRTKSVGHDETTEVKHDRTETVDNNETITIQGNRTETVGKDESISISGNRSETVEKDETININGTRTETVSKDETVTISKGRTVSITEGETISVGKDRATSVSGGDTLSVGKALAITATDSITITTGDASITMNKDGTITIKGKDITIDASGKITQKASGDVILKGSSVKQN